ncbi:MAG TPA: hypothetical protein PLA24_04250 [Tenuifilaceae bacterium]|nr:hypothetical protein [Tenuifilaceae bacterium]
MRKRNTYKKLLSLYLVVVFTAPLLIKATHFLYVHHEHYHSTYPSKTELAKQYQKCPICAFEFVVFFTNTNSQNKVVPEYFSDYTPLYIQSTPVLDNPYSFNLRAPPVTV